MGAVVFLDLFGFLDFSLAGGNTNNVESVGSGYWVVEQIGNSSMGSVQGSFRAKGCAFVIACVEFVVQVLVAV
jgi:hypothetical protein